MTDQTESLREALAYLKAAIEELKEARIDVPMALYRAHRALHHALATPTTSQ